MVAFLLSHIEHLLDHTRCFDCVNIVLKVFIKLGVWVVFLNRESESYFFVETNVAVILEDNTKFKSTNASQSLPHLNHFKVQGLLINFINVGQALFFLLSTLKDDFGHENHFFFHLVANNHCPILFLQEGVLLRVH